MLRLCLLLVIPFVLVGCGTAPPKNINNACAIVQEYPSWYWDAKKAQKRWGVPVNVQFAIIHQESRFRDKAKPPREKLLGFIPWFRPTTAYGYAQAIDGTWAMYQKYTGRHGADRHHFSDATDFVAWYGYYAYKRLGIPRNNAYYVYLAYHEGPGGYQKRSYLKKRWLIDVAKKVRRRSLMYARQLKSCRIPSPSFWSRLFG